jgi:3-isopropylmalate/(R)-2-methylmalate dehydratase small subunit
MRPFSRVTGIAAPFEQANVDTDRIIPARFLRKPRGTGYGRYLFHDLRFGADGSEMLDFVLNRQPYRRAVVLVAGENFGCGSSREGAVWALLDYGFRAVVASSFGDIFFNNCFKNGLLPVVLSKELTRDILEAMHREPDFSLTVDLESQTVALPDGLSHAFEVDAFRRRCLLAGLDDIQLTLAHADDISDFERRRQAAVPWMSLDPELMKPTAGPGGTER